MVEATRKSIRLAVLLPRTITSDEIKTGQEYHLISVARIPHFALGEILEVFMIGQDL